MICLDLSRAGAGDEGHHQLGRWRKLPSATTMLITSDKGRPSIESSSSVCHSYVHASEVIRRRPTRLRVGE